MTEVCTTFQPTTCDELQLFVARNAVEARRALLPVGGGTGLHRVDRTQATEVRLDKLTRVLDYPARDMTITVEAGIRMSELSRILKAENQRLPIDVPQVEQATLGGVIAANWSGARRFGCGTMRDYVIGISAIDASGRLFKAGGRVVKNVAGYDLCKLLVGSLGTLAIITQVTLKLRPIPESSVLVWMTFDSLKQVDAALARLLTSATRPVALEVFNASGSRVVRPGDSAMSRPVLCVGFEGGSREVDWQAETLIAECRPFEPRDVETINGSTAESLWAGLRDFPRAAPHGTLRASLLPSRTLEFLQRATEAGIAAQAHAGNGVVIGHRSATGEEVAWWSNLSRDTSATDWMRRIKQQLDPHNLLNPGVMDW